MRYESAEVPHSGVSISRRSLVAGFMAVPALAGVPIGGERQAASGSAATTPSSRDLWLSLRSRLDGKPTFWYVLGTEFVVVDGAATPYNGRVIVMASLVKNLGGGAYNLPYIETNGSVTSTGHEYAADHRHPITGDAISTKVSDALQLNLTLQADGKITQEVRAANGTIARYDGQYWESPGFGADRYAASKIDVTLNRPNGSIETLTEVSALRPTAGSRGRGYVPAESDTTTSRSVANPERYKGKNVWTVGSYYGRKYQSVDEMRRAMRKIDIEKHAAIFDAWQSWAKTVG